MVITQDFKEFIKSLNDNKVEYLVIGGYAVAYHGHPRYTKDLDVWIKPTEVNLRKFLNALNEFGFGSLDLKLKDFQNREEVVQLGYPPNRIDLVTDIKGVKFDLCYSRRVQTEIEDIEISFIHLEDLKTNKKATGRYQDLADLENLK